LSYAADKQTNKQTDKQTDSIILPTPTDIVGWVMIKTERDRRTIHEIQYKRQHIIEQYYY